MKNHVILLFTIKATYHIQHIIHQWYRRFFFLATPEIQQSNTFTQLQNNHCMLAILETNCSILIRVTILQALDIPRLSEALFPYATVTHVMNTNNIKMKRNSNNSAVMQSNMPQNARSKNVMYHFDTTICY